MVLLQNSRLHALRRLLDRLHRSALPRSRAAVVPARVARARDPHRGGHHLHDLVRRVHRAGRFDPLAERVFVLDLPCAAGCGCSFFG